LPADEYDALLSKNVDKYLGQGYSLPEARELSKIEGMEEFWTDYNYPFLEDAFQRGDNIRVLSNKDYYKNASPEEGSFFKRELEAIEDGWNGNQSLMQKYGYSYDAQTFTYKKN